MPTLVFEIEDGSQVVAPLEGRMTIGSAEGNDIVAEREHIAPFHAEFFRGLDDAWWVRDRSSAAGTLVNGARVMTHRLSPGDHLFFGSISARFSMDTDAGAPQEAEKIIHERRSLVAGLHENRRKLGELATSVSEAAGRHEVISHQVRTLSEQQSLKLLEMERLERDLADLEARRAAAAGALEHLEAGRQRAEESLKLTTLQREQADAELTKLTGEKIRLADDVRRLCEQCGGLGLEISVLDMRKTDMRGVLDGLDKRHVEAVKKLTAAAERLRGTTTRHNQVQADIKKAAADVRSVQSEVESHTSARENLIALNERLQAEVAAVGNRLAELSGTEERLVQARAELHQTEAAQLSLTSVLGEITRKHDASGQAVRELETNIAGLKETQVRLEAEIPALKSSHEKAQSDLAAFKGEAEESRRALTGDIERLRAEASGEQARLSDLLREIDQARLRKTELEQQNRELDATTKRLGEVQAGFRAAELEKNSVEARAQVLRQACSDTQLRLAELESAEKSAGLRVSRLTSQETGLQQAVRQLGDEQQRERKRIEEMRNLSENAEREGLRQKEALAAGIAELHGEIARLETRLAHARSWNEELDQLYEKLGKMPDASPEAREAWLEIQRRKSDITEQLPSGIQVRPQSRPTVVPRGR